MKEIEVKEITKAVAHLLQEAVYTLPDDYLAALKEARENEESPVGREMLDKIPENAELVGGS